MKNEFIKESFIDFLIDKLEESANKGFKETENPHISVPSKFDDAISKYPNSKISRKIVLDAAKKYDVSPDDAIAWVEYQYAVDLSESASIEEKKSDGTISDDEEEKEEALMSDIDSTMDALIKKIKYEANLIGGSFRSPGIEHRAAQLIHAKLQKAKLK